MSENDNIFEPRYTAEDVTIHSKERIFKRYFAIDRYLVSYKRFDGTESKIFDREIFERDSDAVAVMAYDRKTDEIVLIEQFRPGALNDKRSPWLIEIVAGMIDKGETPEEAAVREVKEEIGISIEKSDLHFVTSDYPTPGGASELVTLYIADCDLSKLKKHGGLDSEGEDIRVFKAKLADAYENVKNGRIHNSIAIIAIQHMMLEKEAVIASFENK